MTVEKEIYRNCTPLLIWIRNFLLGRDSLLSNRSSLWMSKKSHYFKEPPKEYYFTHFRYYPNAPT